MVHHITFSPPSQAITAVLGPNGSGKSTLLRAVCGLDRVADGEISWNGTPQHAFTRRAWSQTVAWVPQSVTPNFAYTVEQIVAMGCYTHTRKELVEQALAQMDLLPLRSRPITALSGGERQRTYIARALATDAPLLLLDEPTAHLDLAHAQAIWRHLLHLKSAGKTIVIALHDLAAAERHADATVLLSQGHLEGAGTFGSVVTPERFEQVYGTKSWTFY